MQSNQNNEQETLDEDTQRKEYKVLSVTVESLSECMLSDDSNQNILHDGKQRLNEFNILDDLTKNNHSNPLSSRRNQDYNNFDSNKNQAVDSKPSARENAKMHKSRNVNINQMLKLSKDYRLKINKSLIERELIYPSVLERKRIAANFRKDLMLTNDLKINQSNTHHMFQLENINQK